MTFTIETTTSGHVGEICFSNPPNNHANIALLTALADHLDALDADPEVRAVVLRSEGKVFCGGADLVSTSDGLGLAATQGADDPVRQFYAQGARLFGFGKPLIAAVQGAAVGAGLGLAVAADFRIGTPKARFSANFVKLGFHPGFGLSVTLPRLVGEQQALLMMMTARRLKGEEALSVGLVDQLVEEGALLSTARALASEIAENAPLALLATRRTLKGDLQARVTAALDHEYREQAMLKATADYAEGVAAVFERRAARFTGR